MFYLTVFGLFNQLTGGNVEIVFYTRLVECATGLIRCYLNLPPIVSSLIITPVKHMV